MSGTTETQHFVLDDVDRLADHANEQGKKFAELKKVEAVKHKIPGKSGRTKNSSKATAPE